MGKKNLRQQKQKRYQEWREKKIGRSWERRRQKWKGERNGERRRREEEKRRDSEGDPTSKLYIHMCP